MRVKSWFLVSSLLLSSLWVLSACGGSGKTPELPPPSQVPPAEPPDSDAEKDQKPPPDAAKEGAQGEKSDGAAPTDAAAEKAADNEKPAPASGNEGEESTARNVKYVVNPEGMRVELEGVTFAPKAEAVKVGAGYGLKLKVDVRAKDGKPHSLLAPKNAEVAFAGSVKRKDGEPEKFGDKREGDREIVLKGDKAVQLSRSWPPAGQKPIVNGDELELMVGIWGLGDDAAARRPLKKFCKVTLKFEKDKPRVVVTTPDGVSK